MIDSIPFEKLAAAFTNYVANLPGLIAILAVQLFIVIGLMLARRYKIFQYGTNDPSGKERKFKALFAGTLLYILFALPVGGALGVTILQFTSSNLGLEEPVLFDTLISTSVQNILASKAIQYTYPYSVIHTRDTCLNDMVLKPENVWKLAQLYVDDQEKKSGYPSYPPRFLEAVVIDIDRDLATPETIRTTFHKNGLILRSTHESSEFPNCLFSK